MGIIDNNDRRFRFRLVSLCYIAKEQIETERQDRGSDIPGNAQFP